MAKRLTAASVRRLPAGVYADAACTGLYLHVAETGGRSWVLRTSTGGRRREIGLGSAELVTLAEAREATRELRKVARAGGDPAAHRDRSRAPGRTLRQAVEQFHRERIEPTAKHERDAKRWIAEVDRWALAELGDKPLRTLTRGDVLHALEAATAKAPTVARRLRQRLHAVMERARVAGEIDTNPAAGVEAGLPARRHETEHHEAIPWQEAPAAAAALWADGSIAALAVLFAALTATRGAEVRGATWGEIEDGLWTIPAARMKTGREHVVPLSPAAMALLDRVKPAARGDALIFPGARPGRPTDPSTMLRTMRRIDARGSVHGWRSTFRDWCFDNGVERELAEACLAHQPATAVEAAYRRGTALDRRREAINSWGDHIFS